MLIRPESGLRPQTWKHLDLDVGAGWVNCNLDELFDTGDVSTIIARMKSVPWLDPNGIEQTPYQAGATQGGITYNPGVTQRQVDVDGRKSNIKELWRVDMIEPTLKFNFIESADPDILAKYHGAAEQSVVGPYTRIRPQFVVDPDRDFWWNMVVIQTVSGSTLPKLYIINNPHVSTSEEVSMAPNSEAVIPVTVTGNNPIADPYGDLIAAAEVWVPIIATS